MYHAVIGKRLVECVNEHFGRTYTIYEFFNEIYAPLFFGSAKILQHVGNSPFFQRLNVGTIDYTRKMNEGMSVTQLKKEAKTDAAARYKLGLLYYEGEGVGRNKTEAQKWFYKATKLCVKEINKKINDSAPDASFFLGGPAAGIDNTTSGQVTSMQIPITREDIYASWLGAACGMTVEGGFTILIDSKDVLLAIFEGWKEYRNYLNQTSQLKPLQINTWNGQWVTYKMRGLSDKFAPNAKTEKGVSKLVTQSWIQLLFALSFHFNESQDPLLAYVYSLGKMNRTIGFVKLNLPSVRRPVDFYNKLFTVPDGLPAYAFEELYQTETAFEKACLMTEIGLRAIKPKDIFNADNKVPKPPTNVKTKLASKEENIAYAKKKLAFQTYQTWIIAMLNNKDLYQHANDLAKALQRFQQQSTRGKTTRKQMVQEILDKKNLRDFIDVLTGIVNEDDSERATFEQIVIDILALPVEKVPLFLTLVRFSYAVTEKQKEVSS